MLRESALLRQISPDPLIAVKNSRSAFLRIEIMLRISPAIARALACLSLTGGCAAFATKMPTPAAELSPRSTASLTAPPGVRYFLIVFGSETAPKTPKFTHTWATVMKVTGCEGQASVVVEEQTISWMPASLDIRPFSFRVEPGRNLGLHFTLKEMICQKEHISFWGPFEISPGFALRFEVQKSFLELGRAGYQCIDSIGEARTGAGCNCIHAITDMDPHFDRSQYPLSFFGVAASQNIVRQIHLRPIIICPDMDHRWLLPFLSLDKYPIRHCQYIGHAVPNTPENLERYLRKFDRSRSCDSVR